MTMRLFTKGEHVYCASEDSYATVVEDLNEAYGVPLFDKRHRLFDCGVTVRLDVDGSMVETDHLELAGR